MINLKEVGLRVAEIIQPEVFDRTAFLKLVDTETRRKANRDDITRAMMMAQAESFNKALQVIELVYNEITAIEGGLKHGREQTPEEVTDAAPQESCGSGAGGQADSGETGHCPVG